MKTRSIACLAALLWQLLWPLLLQADEVTPPESPVAPAGAAESEVVVTLDAIEIIGNDELPSIMHIVPWKQADPGVIPGRPVDSLLNDIIAPVDRHEYRRELRYHDALYSDRSKP